MDIKVGYTYTLNEDYFKKRPNENLSVNKGGDLWQKGGRPYFIALQDELDPKTYWAVPLSSNTQKYSKVIQGKIAKRGFCNTLHIGRFGNRETTWLVQNMCPVDGRHVRSLCSTPQGQPLMPDRQDARIVSAMAKGALERTRAGVRFLNVDVLKLYRELDREHRALESRHARNEGRPISTKERFADAQKRARDRNASQAGRPRHRPGRGGR